MTLYATNFTANSLNGTVVVTAGKANIGLIAQPFYLEGNKTFYLKLRKNSVDGPVIGVTTGTLIPDRSRIVSVTANITQVAEGNLVTYSIVTANVNVPTTLFYETNAIVGNVNSTDFTSGNTGSVVITSNVGTITFGLSPDLTSLTEEGEKFGIRLKNFSQTGNIIYQTTASTANGLVEILDVSKVITVSRVLANATTATDYSIVQWAVTTLNANNNAIYYTTVGDLPNSELLSANTGSFTPDSNSNLYVLTMRLGNVTAQPRNFKLQFRENGLTGNIRYLTPNVQVTALPFQLSSPGGIASLAGNTQLAVVGYTGAGSMSIAAPQGGIGLTNGVLLEYMAIGGGAGGGIINTQYFSTTPAGSGGYTSGTVRIYAGNVLSIQVGAGGVGGISQGGYSWIPNGGGSNTVISSTALAANVIALGGTGGEGAAAKSGGSAGGGALSYGSPAISVAGTQGYPGGASPAPNTVTSAGGGGVGGSGGTGSTNPNGFLGQPGGPGISIDIGPLFGISTGNPLARSIGGGGSGGSDGPQGTGAIEGGSGGGGGHYRFYGVPTNGNNGNVNTGGGGGTGAPGGAFNTSNGGQGGSGLVVLRYLPNAIPAVSAGPFPYNP